MKDAGELQVISSPRVTTKEARELRARCWMFIFDAYRRKAIRPSAPDNQKAHAANAD